MKIPFDFTSIPGCIVWAETDASGVTDRLAEKTGQRNTHYVWENPSNSDEGILLVFNREPTAEEEEQIQAAIVEYYNDPADLPGGD